MWNRYKYDSIGNTSCYFTSELTSKVKCVWLCPAVMHHNLNSIRTESWHRRSWNVNLSNQTLTVRARMNLYVHFLSRYSPALCAKINSLPTIIRRSLFGLVAIWHVELKKKNWLVSMLVFTDTCNLLSTVRSMLAQSHYQHPIYHIDRSR